MTANIYLPPNIVYTQLNRLIEPTANTINCTIFILL